MWIADGWRDYEVLDAGDGEKLERWGSYILRRPDPQVIWGGQDLHSYADIDAVYHRSEKGGGAWEKRKSFPAEWTVSYKDLTFKIKPLQAPAPNRR